MQIQEIRNLMKDEDGINLIVESYQSCFDDIDSIILELKNDKLNDEKSLLSAQTKLTGLYGTLITVFKVAEATKIHIEAQKFVTLNDEYEKNNPGAKSLSAFKLDKLTAVEIATWRTVRNIFEGYVLAAEKAIITCQSNLKNLKTERIFSNANPEKY
jgi:hypothetical protein